MPTIVAGCCRQTQMDIYRMIWLFPMSSAHGLANGEPLTARDVRSALWLCAGNVTRAAKRLGIPPARIRSFTRNSPWIQQEFAEARERILDRAEAVLQEALFSDDPKRCDSAARYILTKSQSGRARFHALTEHLNLETRRGYCRHSLGGMTILFDRVLRHRCPNDVQALIPPAYDKFPPFERLDDHREQVRAALWQFGGIITVAAHYLRVEPTRLRRFVNEIDRSLLEDIERIEVALTEYAQAVQAGRVVPPTVRDNVTYIRGARERA